MTLPIACAFPLPVRRRGIAYKRWKQRRGLRPRVGETVPTMMGTLLTHGDIIGSEYEPFMNRSLKLAKNGRAAPAGWSNPTAYSALQGQAASERYGFASMAINPAI